MSQLLLTNNTINPTRNATFTQTFMFPHFITSFCQTLNGGKKFIENKSTFFQVNILEKKLKLIYFLQNIFSPFQNEYTKKWVVCSNDMYDWLFRNILCSFCSCYVIISLIWHYSYPIIFQNYWKLWIYRIKCGSSGSKRTFSSPHIKKWNSPQNFLSKT